ncbi:MAG: nitroreductase family protein, partial [Actinomycetes bacterium]
MTTRAIRRFTADPVSDADIEHCLKVAQQAPSGGNVPTGKSFSDLVNLSDPDASDPLITAGSNSGLIAITVEGRTYRNGAQVGRATVTKEYEVLPKCCGGSFGSNGSGGKNVSTNSLGSDSRFCGVEFGMIIGLNQGKLWSYYSNDRYTKRNENNEIVNVHNILGIVDDAGAPFSRAGTNFPGCRVIPGECSTNQVYATSGASDGAMYPTLFSGFSYSCT